MEATQEDKLNRKRQKKGFLPGKQERRQGMRRA